LNYSIKAKRKPVATLASATGFPVNLLWLAYSLLTPAHGIPVALPYSSGSDRDNMSKPAT
jgi:hypothetical protein